MANFVDLLFGGNGFGSRPLMFYGAGGIGRRFFDFCEILDVCPDYFVDRNPELWGKKITRSGGRAVEIISPEKAKSFSLPRMILLMGLTYSAVRSMREYGFDDYCDIPPSVKWAIWGTSWDKTGWILSRLADEKSRETMKKVIRFYIDGDLSGLEEIEESDQYFPTGIVELSDSEVFVDGGGWDGYSALDFIRRTAGRFSGIHIFEPQSEQEPVIRAVLGDYGADRRVSVVMKALYDHSGTVGFGGYTVGAHVCNDADSLSGDAMTNVPAVSLDEYFAGTGMLPSFIKMDIEGSELRALKGAAECIAKAHPVLAISVYHRLGDYHDIPLYLMENYPFYDFYIRHHTASQYDTVLYAVPKNRGGQPHEKGHAAPSRR